MCTCDLIGQGRATPGLGGPDDSDAESGSEPGRLLRPGSDDAGGGHHEHRSLVQLSQFAGTLHEREGLERLAKPHVVGEHPTESGVPECDQPGKSTLLVGTQRGRETTGNRYRLLPDTSVPERLHPFQPAT